MTLIDNIRERLTRTEPDTVLRTMGYTHPEHARERLESLLSATDIESWLHRSGYDFKYSGKEFLRKLFEALSLPTDALEAELTRIDTKTVALAKMKQPYIFVDTHFKRAGQPVFVLGALEWLRHLLVPKEDLYSKGLNEVLEMVGAFIHRHYIENDGELQLWGVIYRYIYRHSDGRDFVFDTEGRLIPETQEVEESMAVMRLHGKPFGVGSDEQEQVENPAR